MSTWISRYLFEPPSSLLDTSPEWVRDGVVQFAWFADLPAIASRLGLPG